MELYEGLLDGSLKLSVMGLGYVGLPLAVAFARKVGVIGFDPDTEKIRSLRSGADPTGEAGNEAVAATTAVFTASEALLREARFHIVAVPTPVHADHTPDLGPLREASRTLGRNLAPGSAVVYESTVYPGVTEEICLPILERESGLAAGKDFKVGYSPERINPGDRVHRLNTVVKIVSGMDAETLHTVARVYELVAEAGVYRAASIRVAEAAKVIENSQRDINIAFMNELSMIFGRMGIDTGEVLAAAGTKWNFLPFSPGLVGGHCIGVDPYYLTYRAQQAGYHPQVILAGRRINDEMGRYVARETVKRLVAAGRPVGGARVAVLGLTFKENCPDTRNTRVADLLDELAQYGVTPAVADPVADAGEVRRRYGIALADLRELRNLDGVIVAVAHDAFRALSPEDMDGFFDGGAPGRRVLADVKGILDRRRFEDAGYLYWRL